MFRISIYRNEKLTNQASFSTREELDAWLEFHQSQKTFGEPEKTIKVLVSEEVPELREIQSVLVTPEVRDPETDEVITEAVYEDQEVITQEYAPAVYRDEVIPAEYTIEITDVTAETEALNQIAEAKAYLASKDYMTIREMQGGEPMPAEIKAECARLRTLINSLEEEFDLK